MISGRKAVEEMRKSRAELLRSRLASVYLTPRAFRKCVISGNVEKTLGNQDFGGVDIEMMSWAERCGRGGVENEDAEVA